MAQIVTCPRCGKMERYKGTAHTQCTFCKSPLSESPSRPEGRPGPDYPQGDMVLRMTLVGGLVGGVITTLISLGFYGFHLFVVTTAPAAFGADPKPVAANLLIRLVAIPACAGLAEGALLMAVASALFQRYPTMLRSVSAGGALGALAGPAVVGFTIVLPAALGPRAVPQHDLLWLMCLAAAAIGAPLGMALLFALHLVRMAARPDSRPELRRD